MSDHKYSRRHVLARFGVGAALVPVLRTERRARAAAASPKRLVIVAAEQGVMGHEFWPRGSGTALDGLTFGKSTEPLKPFASDVLFVGGLQQKSFLDDMKTRPKPGGGHEAWNSMLTGISYADFGDNIFVPGGPSIDLHVGLALQKRHALPFQAIAATATMTGSERNAERTVSATARGQLFDAEKEPVKLFDRIFGGLGNVGGDLARLRASRRSMLDRVGRQLEAYAKHMGSENRVIIEAHLDSVRNMERQISVLQASTCAAPVRPELRRLQSDFTTTEKNYAAQRLLPAVTKLHSDLLVAALTCDLTRVYTLCLGIRGTGLGTVLNEWPGFTGDVGTSGAADHHAAITHGENANLAAVDRKVAVDRWVTSQYAYIVGELKKRTEATDPARSMLDTAAVVFVNNQGDGGKHNVTGLPWVIAGNCGGYFKTGRVLKGGGWAGVDDAYWKKGGYVPHNGMLVALSNAMDVPVPTFGDPLYGGELAGLRG